MAKDLYFSDTNLGKCLTDRYALWLDLRSIDDNTLHGSGRRMENAGEGVTIQIEKKKQESDETLNIYLYIVQDAQSYLLSYHLSSQLKWDYQNMHIVPSFVGRLAICYWSVKIF